VIENHLRFIIGRQSRHTACKHLVNVYKFRLHVYLIKG